MTAPRGRGERVLVVAKAPAPGRTKTRLCPPLSPEEAAALGRAMLLDTLETCRAESDDVGILYADPRGGRGAACPGRARRAARAPGRRRADGRAPFRAPPPHLPARTRWRSSRPTSPASRRARSAGPSPSSEGGADVVLGPGLDGGYWLVALRAPHAAPFEDIPWSTPDVLDVDARALRGRRPRGRPARPVARRRHCRRPRSAPSRPRRTARPPHRHGARPPRSDRTHPAARRRPSAGGSVTRP